MTTQLKQNNEPLLEVNGLKKYFPVKNQLGQKSAFVKAVDDVSFKLYEGKTLGLVGESGCGKSTTGRSLLRLIEPTSGSALFDGKDIFKLKGKELREARQDLQMVFQDPFSSLNPRKRIGEILEEPLKIHKLGSSAERTEKVMDILHKVGLNVDHYYRYPHEFSGGQRQRIVLARALILNPKIIVCDEPVSALDVSTQAQIVNLLRGLQEELKLTYLFIAHDISVVRHISDQIGVMYLGNIVEYADTDNIFAEPLHPYTQALLSAVPKSSPNAVRERIVLKGEIPSPLNPPSGCVFHPRCPMATELCSKEIPVNKEARPGHFVKCHLY
ncbi:dipeptide ABC transporter ATP-binding protein [Ureibacillus composti]|nr:dipeptide ABC transporter ATP-binding protein [Ureibacillus composti]